MNNTISDRVLRSGGDTDVEAPPAYSPATLPSLRVLLRAGVGCWQDAAGTIPAVQDGDPVGRWDDLRGLAWPSALQPTSAARPTLRSVGGKWVVRFDGADDFLTLSGTNLGATPEMLLTTRVHTYTANGVILSATGNGFFVGTYLAGSGNVGANNSNGILLVSLPLPLGQLSTVAAHLARGAGANTSRFAVGLSAPVAFTVVASDYTALDADDCYLGRFAAPGHYQNCDLAEVALCAARVPDTDRAAYLAYTATVHGAV
jgi:hypothetical protein